MNDYIVTIEFEVIQIRVKGKNISDARAKALKRLKTRNPVNMIKRAWRTGRREINIDEI